MSKVEELVRDDVKKLSPYVCARDLYKEADIFLDANENAFGSTAQFNGIDLARYPDSDLLELRSGLAKYLSPTIKPQNIIVGNGSDEIIDLAIRTFAEKGENIVSIVPDYSMFDVCAEISGVKVKKVLMEENFQPNVEKVLSSLDDKTKMIFLVSPNSPVGNTVEFKRIKDLLEKSNRIVFVDEAYGEFAGKTLASEVLNYENLIVSKTLSKAWGLAALRVGYAIANPKIIENMRKIKPPYNVSAVSNALALQALKNKDKMVEFIRKMFVEKQLLESELKKLNLQVFETVANFSVFRLPKQFDSKQVQKRIAGKGIIVRDRSSVPMMENCIRVTVGKREENGKFLAALKEALKK